VTNDITKYTKARIFSEAGKKTELWNHRVDTDYYSQPGALFRLMAPARRRALFDNTARSMRGSSEAVQDRHVYNCLMADPLYGQGVADALGQGRSARRTGQDI
jgi:catalase